MTFNFLNIFMPMCITAPPSVRLLSSVRVILSESLADAAHAIYLEKSSSKVNHLLRRVKVFVPPQLTRPYFKGWPCSIEFFGL